MRKLPLLLVTAVAVVLALPAASLADADVALSVTDSPDPVAAGSNLTYTITVENGGPDSATNVMLGGNLAPGTTFVSLAGPGGWSVTTPAVGAGGAVTASRASLGAGSPQTFTLVVRVDPSLGSGSVINKGTFVSSDNDPDASDDSVVTSTTVSTGADLSLAVSDSPDPVVAGTNLTYTIDVANNGPSDAQNVAISDAIPAGTTFQSLIVPAGWVATAPPVGATGTVTITRATWASGSTGTITLVVRVDPDAPAGLSNVPAIGSTTNDATAGNNSETENTTATRSADLSAALTGTPGTITAGDEITYTAALANAGPSAALNPRLVFQPPAGGAIVSTTQTGGPAFSCTGTLTLTCQGTSLNPANQAAFEIVVRTPANGSGPVSATATASADSSDADSADDADSASTTLNKRPAGSAPPPPVRPQQRATKLAVGDVRMSRRSGIVFVPVTCVDTADSCTVTAAVEFHTRHHKLADIERDGIRLARGQVAKVMLIAPKSQRRRMKRIGTMPITARTTAPPTASESKAALLKGKPRRRS